MKTEELINVIEQHDLDQLTALLVQGADPSHGLPHHPESLPLHVAVEEMSEGGSIEAVALLLKHGARADGNPNERSATPLLLALMHGLKAVVLLLLVAGADPNFVSDEGVSALRWAVEHNEIDIAAMLLRFGAKQSINDSGGPSGMNALGRAASNLNIPMIKLLLLAGANLSAHDADYRTARDRLPNRDTNPMAWDEAIKLLA